MLRPRPSGRKCPEADTHCPASDTLGQQPRVTHVTPQGQINTQTHKDHQQTPACGQPCPQTQSDHSCSRQMGRPCTVGPTRSPLAPPVLTATASHRGPHWGSLGTAQPLASPPLSPFMALSLLPSSPPLTPATSLLPWLLLAPSKLLVPADPNTFIKYQVAVPAEPSGRR